MTAREVLTTLRARARPDGIEGLARFGIRTDTALGVPVPDLRRLAADVRRAVKDDTTGEDARDDQLHQIAADLWRSGVHEARTLAGMIDAPARVTPEQMEDWAADFDSWDVVDLVCSDLFDQTPFAYAKAREWAGREEEFVKRAGFCLMACLAVHDKEAPDAKLAAFFSLIEREAWDERNFVKKAVNWALRQIGKRNAELNRQAVACAERVLAQATRSARWTARDALRELRSDKVRKRLKAPGAPKRTRRAAKPRATHHFAPDLVHQRLAEETQPRLAYDGGDVKRWQGRLRRKLRDLLKAPAPTERVDLNPRTLWRREHELGVIEKVVFTAEPMADVPAYVCLPRDAEPPYPFMICLQGHSPGMALSIGADPEDDRKPTPVAGDRDFALGCLRRGVAALCIEQRALGERRDPNWAPGGPPVCYDAACRAMLLGRTLLGERVFDVDRAIDYLRGRGDADSRRIGVMGNSGGGMTSIFAAALLPRLAFAIPSCAFCSYREAHLAIRHCLCSFVPGLYEWADMAEVLGIFAPKPVVVVAGKEDNIAPIKAVRREFRRLKQIYAAADAADNCRLVVGPEAHRFYADAAWRRMAPILRRSAQ